MDLRLGTGMVLELFGNVARAAELRRLDEDHLETELPFDKLSFVRMLEDDGPRHVVGVPLESIAPLLALPSMRNFASVAIDGGNLNWPSNLPKSRVSSIRLSGKPLDAKSMLQWADGLRGPCLVHQRAYRRRKRWGNAVDRHFDREREWDYFKIPFEDAGRGD